VEKVRILYVLGGEVIDILVWSSDETTVHEALQTGASADRSTLTKEILNKDRWCK
jgi:hypothetical protein